jgi:transglutaminase-like putative cysteine protease
MKIKLHFLLSVLFLFPLLTSFGQGEKHFISDKKYRDVVHQDFLKRENLSEERKLAMFSIFNGSITSEEREALEFLYAYMPLSDLADYNGDYFLKQVRYSFLAENSFTWGKTVPEDIFRHFVLVYRVNNENLDTARSVIFNELKDRIKGMNMHDAALEVNHWCHEKVSYRASDIRTSSPLATIKTAYGRCGEESTFTVTALRAVGIPARQCYTPRWAHTDDNHAWVEVWVDGKWYFLGACEPDAELNMGWFAVPATRAMMVHSNAFGKYKGQEEINYQTDLFSRINMLPNYTDTKKITVKVTDNNGTPVKDADVKFKLYNYAEYYPIASRKTDEKGMTTLTTGLGDLLIWASKNEKYNYGKIDVRKNDTLSLSLMLSPGKEYVEMFEMIPPKGFAHSSDVSQEKIDRNNRRLQYEDSIRNAYLSTFMSEDQAKRIQNENLNPEQLWEIIRKSEGNYAEIVSFLNNHKVKDDNLFLYDYLSSLADKDLRDINHSVLEQQLTTYKKELYPFEVYKKGILSPRISNEGIRPWRQYLADKLSKIFVNKPSSEQIANWIKKNILIDDQANYFNCPVSPRGVFELRIADSHSRDIFFVAACRSLNIPAYLDNATNQIFVYEQNAWNLFSFEETKEKGATGTLILTYNGTNELKPEYWTHYTIAKEKDGDFETFDYEGDARVSEFPAKLELEAGYYLISTGNRYSDGEVLSRVEFFNIAPGQTVTKNIELRPLEPRDVNYGKIDLQHLIVMASGQKLPVADLLKDRELVLCFVDPTREPTKHLFKDIAAFKSQFETWNGNILFVIPSDKRTADFNAASWKLPQQSQFIYDDNAEWMNAILKSSKQEFSGNYPLIFIVNSKGELLFKSEGYRIGTGELIYKSLFQGCVKK